MMGIMRISTEDKHLLAHLQLLADAPLSDLSRIVGMSQHKVRYCVDKFLSAGVLRRSIHVNLSLLGITEYALYLHASHNTPEAKKHWLRELVLRKDAGHVYELDGELRYNIVVLTRDSLDAQHFCYDLCKQQETSIHGLTVAVRISSTIFPRQYLAPRANLPKEIVTARSTKQVTIDELDEKILAGLASGEFRHKTVLARALGVASSTLDLRIQRLKKEEVIVNDYYSMSLSYFQIRSYKVLLSLRVSTPEMSAQVHDFARNHPHIVQITTLVGSWDHELLLEVYSAEHHNDVLDQLSNIFAGSLNSICSLPIVARHKVSQYPHAKS